jgi:CheY-like chemotaxis protein
VKNFGKEFAKKQVLFVDDVQTNLQLAKIVLTRMRCTVDTAGNGREAVAKALSKPFDIIYMDCQMPDMDGYEATKEIRSRLTRHVPIMAITASVMESDRQRCLAAGMDDFLSKPFTHQQLATLLRRWLALRALPESERRTRTRHRIRVALLHLTASPSDLKGYLNRGCVHGSLLHLLTQSQDNEYG